VSIVEGRLLTPRKRHSYWRANHKGAEPRHAPGIRSCRNIFVSHFYLLRSGWRARHLEKRRRHLEHKGGGCVRRVGSDRHARKRTLFCIFAASSLAAFSLAIRASTMGLPAYPIFRRVPNPPPAPSVMKSWKLLLDGVSSPSNSPPSPPIPLSTALVSAITCAISIAGGLGARADATPASSSLPSSAMPAPSSLDISFANDRSKSGFGMLDFRLAIDVELLGTATTDSRTICAAFDGVS
jgi:hypothetical protein